MSLHYYKEFGWDVEVICVDEKFVEGFRDNYLLETVPENVLVHRVEAWPLSATSRFGLGSLSIRSYYYFKKKGTALLKRKKFDLVFFSTTMFHVCALGRYWKEKFGVPFVIDLQDPWRNDFYLSKPKAERPPKFWLAHFIHKHLEAMTMPYADGIMAVSRGYIEEVKKRYPVIKNIPSVVIPFGCAVKDFELVKERNLQPEIIGLNDHKINVVYLGAVTKYFLPLIQAFFESFKKNIRETAKYHFYFIGTSYTTGKPNRMVEKLAEDLDMQGLVTEVSERISYFSAIATMQQADILFIPGSMDVDYNASKIYNNILAKKPIFSVFNNRSLVKEIVEKSNAGIVVGVDGQETLEEIVALIDQKMGLFETLHTHVSTVELEMIESFTARNKTKEQVAFFNSVILNKQKISL